MKAKICLILVFLFSFYSSNFTEATCMSDSTNLDLLKEEIYDNESFVENGVKVTYKSHSRKEDEIEALKKRLEKKFNEKIVVNDYEIDIGTSYEKIKADFYYKDDTTIVDLEIINTNEKVSISKLMKELTELEGKNIFNIRYFQYIKGKINNINDILTKIKSIQQIKNIDTRDIHNGYVGTANFNNGERVNIALNSYDTGNYLIIGTPVIFTTY